MSNLRKGFSIVVLPDSQRYVEDGFRKERLHCLQKQIDWIIGNAERYNIRFVSHVGDFTHHRSSAAEREAFFECVRKLEGKIPFGFCAGNHDILLGEKAAELIAARGKTADPADYDHPEVQAIQDEAMKRLRKQPGWIGDINGGNTSAQLFETDAGTFCAVHLEYGPTDETLAWARAVLEKHAECPAFLTTHMFLTPEEPQMVTSRSSRLSTLQNNMVSPGENAGTDILEKLIAPCGNLKMVFCGHYSDECRMTIKLNGRRICAMQMDYELEQPYRGNGWLRLVTVSPNEGTLTASTYSPVFDAWRLRDKSDFTMEWL